MAQIPSKCVPTFRKDLSFSPTSRSIHDILYSRVPQKWEEVWETFFYQLLWQKEEFERNFFIRSITSQQLRTIKIQPAVLWKFRFNILNTIRVWELRDQKRFSLLLPPKQAAVLIRWVEYLMEVKSRMLRTNVYLIWVKTRNTANWKSLPRSFELHIKPIN